MSAPETVVLEMQKKIYEYRDAFEKKLVNARDERPGFVFHQLINIVTDAEYALKQIDEAIQFLESEKEEEDDTDWTTELDPDQLREWLSDATKNIWERFKVIQERIEKDGK